MLNLNRQIGTLAILFVLTLAASSQTSRYSVPAASLRDNFSPYHNALDNAADLALANVAREPVISRQASETAGSRTYSPNTEVLRQFAKQYWNGNEGAVRRAIARVTQLRPTLTPILREEGIPDEVAAVVVIESAGQAMARALKGARGIWQFMPDTARRYGLVVTADRDERIEVVKSTRAAARYLHDVYRKFGDWRLAFAAYNAGERAVERAMTRTGHADFSQIDRALPEETRSYVPAVLHAMELLGSNKPDLLPGGESERSPSGSVLYASTERAD